MSVGEFVSDAWHRFQGNLFPFLAEEVGPPSRRYRRFIAVLDLAEVERRVHSDRNALARAFMAKAVWGLPTTSALIDRLRYDPTLRGWCRLSKVPSKSTFSRAFAWLAETRLPERMHEARVRGGSVRGKVRRRSGSRRGWSDS